MMVDWTTSVGLMTERPKLMWAAEPGALYMVVLVDAGIQSVLPKVYAHWMVTNIPGNQVELGDEVMQYVTPFSLELDDEANIIKDREQSKHPMIFLAFKQPGRIVAEETQAGCSPDIVDARIHNVESIARKYRLELVAGNFLQVPWTPSWSGFHSQQMLCRVSRCAREPFPFTIPGVNDMAECQPRSDVQDITIIGPKLAKRKIYSKYRSLLSLDSVTSEIQNRYPDLSTGRIADYLAIEGSYNASPFTNNQATTLEGVIDFTFLEYPTKSKTAELFRNAQDLLPSIKPIFFTTNSVAGGGPLNIVLSQPYDQDFDFMTVLDKPGMIMEVSIVDVKEGRKEEFLRLREKLIAKSRSSKNVVSMTKFSVITDIVDPADPLYFDLSNTELTITIFDNQAAMKRAFAELADRQFFDTFTCSACSVVDGNLHPTYYPPFE